MIGFLQVAPATQASFRQYAVKVDMASQEMIVLGEVSKRFVVSPDIDTLLAAMELRDSRSKTVVEGEESLITMDTS
jgi:DNA-directed RNA polymerase III subunit RPC4